ncbi:hypothetical protein [Tenacibaculum sp.]|uniref:hypothetical protein n=1 Tax=Tenacibaculum sp. TaxID=1906242 RepID=UPI003D13AD70
MLTLEDIKGKTFFLRSINPDKWAKVRRFNFTSEDLGPGIDKHGLPVTGLTEDSMITNEKGNKEVVKGTRGILEKELGLEEGQLKKGTLINPSPFWTSFTVKMETADLELNGDDPNDQLKILFLAAQNNIAVGIKNRLSKSEYLLYTKEDAAKDSNKKKKVKREAYRIFDELTIEDKTDILEMLGVKAKTLTVDIIEDRLSDVVEESPTKFLAIAQDPKRKQKTYVRKCLDKGFLTMQDGAVMYGETVLGYDINSAADNLFSDTNAKTREALKIQITGK